MKTVFPASLLLVAVASAAAIVITAAPTTASAQCEPGAVFCAQVEIHGGLQWGTPPPPPPPAVVYVQPAPPPPPVVVYRPAPPPPVVVYQPAPPQPVVVYQQEQRQQYWLEGDGTWGLHGHIGGTVSNNLYMGGGEVGLRWRPRPRFALDLGIGGYAGIDYQGEERVEIPLTANFLFFFNPRSRLQWYALAGVGLSFAEVGGDGDWRDGGDHDHDGFDDFDDGEGMAYYGGMLGFGLEWRLSPHFALNTDLRGFIRHRFSGESNTPEFVELGPDGRPTGRATDTSGGGLLTLGGTFYF